LYCKASGNKSARWHKLQDGSAHKTVCNLTFTAPVMLTKRKPSVNRCVECGIHKTPTPAPKGNTVNIMNPQHRCTTFNLHGPINRKSINCNDCGKVASSDVRVGQITHLNGVPIEAICRHCNGDMRAECGTRYACVRSGECVIEAVPSFGVIDVDCTGMMP